MKKIESYDETMAFFLVTPDEMHLLSSSVLLELEYESILKRARFSEMIFGQYCIRADLKFLDRFLCYVENILSECRDKKFGNRVKRLAGQIREAFFNPEVQRKEEAALVVDGAMEVIRHEEMARDPAYQELIAEIKPLFEKIDALGGTPRIDFLECPFCGAQETDNFEGERSLLDSDEFPTGHTEMVILEDHEEQYGGAESEEFIIVYKFMCPACNMIQTAVTTGW